MCVRAHVCRGLHVTVQGQLVGVCSCLPPCGPRAQTQVAMLGSRHLCPRSHLTGLDPVFTATRPFLFAVLLSEATSLSAVV